VYCSLLFLIQANFLGHRNLVDDEFTARVLDSMSFNTFVAERGPPYRVCDIFDEVCWISSGQCNCLYVWMMSSSSLSLCQIVIILAQLDMDYKFLQQLLSFFMDTCVGLSVSCTAHGMLCLISLGCLMLLTLPCVKFIQLSLDGLMSYAAILARLIYPRTSWGMVKFICTALIVRLCT